MLFKRSFGLTRSMFILYVHEPDRLGFGMLTVEVETAVIPGLYLIAFVDFNCSNCERKGQSYPVEYYLESVEKCSEGKIRMSEPKSGNGNVDTVYFVNQASGNTLISRTEFVGLLMNDHTTANVSLDLSFLLRIMFVKNILLQISFCA